MYPIQLSGGSSQMLLLQWRYVNQCNLEITLTSVTWVGPLGSRPTYKHRQIADYPTDLQSKAVFLRWVCDISAFAGNTVEKHKKGTRHLLLYVTDERDLEPRCCKHCGAASVLLCWLTEWPKALLILEINACWWRLAKLYCFSLVFKKPFMTKRPVGMGNKLKEQTWGNLEQCKNMQMYLYVSLFDSGGKRDFTAGKLQLFCSKHSWWEDPFSVFIHIWHIESI